MAPLCVPHSILYSKCSSVHRHWGRLHPLAGPYFATVSPTRPYHPGRRAMAVRWSFELVLRAPSTLGYTLTE